MVKENQRKYFKNNSLVLLITTIIGLIALTIILINTDMKEIFDFFRNTTAPLVIFFILIQIFLMITHTIRWSIVLKSQGYKKINLFRLNRYRIAGQAVSFFTPMAKMGGEGTKTNIMAKRESVSYSRALSSVVIDNAVDLTASGFFFLIGTIIVLLSINTNMSVKLFLGTLVVCFIIALSIFNYKLFKGKSLLHSLSTKLGLFKFKKIRMIEKEIKTFDEQLHRFYKKDKKSFFYAVSLSFITWIFMFLEYYVAGKMLGLNFSLGMIFLIVTLVGIAYLIPVPMALGTLEAGQMSAFIILSISTAAALGLSFIIRAKDLLIALWGMGIISFYGFNFNKSLQKVGFGDEVENEK